MTKEELNELKENKDIKFIYKIPCSFYPEGFEYIVIGLQDIPKKNNIRVFSLDSWFIRMKAGSILPYVCATLPRSGKVKELVNIYEKPDVLILRKFIGQITDKTELIQECLWGEQYIREGKVNRVDVFRNKYYDPIKATNLFYDAVNPIYTSYLNKKSNE